MKEMDNKLSVHELIEKIFNYNLEKKDTKKLNESKNTDLSFLNIVSLKDKVKGLIEIESSETFGEVDYDSLVDKYTDLYDMLEDEKLFNDKINIKLEKVLNKISLTLTGSTYKKGEYKTTNKINVDNFDTEDEEDQEIVKSIEEGDSGWGAEYSSDWYNFNDYASTLFKNYNDALENAAQESYWDGPFCLITFYRDWEPEDCDSGYIRLGDILFQVENI